MKNMIRAGNLQEGIGREIRESEVQSGKVSAGRIENIYAPKEKKDVV